MTSQVPNRHCIYCNQDKPWIFSGKKLKDGSKIYTNEFALRWSGRRCPDCERSRVQSAVRCDLFEKELVIKELKQAGYKVHNRSLPIKVEKDGQILTVGLRHAYTEDGKITIDKGSSSQADMYAMVFSSVRFCSAEQMDRLGPQLQLFKAQADSLETQQQ